MRSVLLFAVTLIAFVACNNLEDANPANRNTFAKFFEGPHSLSATAVEVIPGGYVILGNMRVNDTLTITTVIQTDENGNRIGDIHYLPGGTGNAIKPLTNSGNVTGYVVVGDSVKINPSPEQAANIVIASLRVLQLNENFQQVNQYYKTDKRPISPTHPVKLDYFGHTITVTDDGKIFVLGSVKEGIITQQTASEKSLLIELNNALDSVWSIQYDIYDRTYRNSRSIFYRNNKIIWASAIAIDQGGFYTSFVGIPVAEQQSTFVNFSLIGETSQQLFIPSDITPAHNPAFGYGVAGTYSIETNGSKANLFFLRVNSAGDIIPGSDRYFDGASATNSLADPTQSNVLDAGETITSTNDGGYVIAGTTSLTSENGKDVWLLKVNALGEAVWSKFLGGSGDEVPSSVRELPNGELLICGTNTVGGFSSIFLIKTDRNGELNK